MVLNYLDIKLFRLESQFDYLNNYDDLNEFTSYKSLIRENFIKIEFRM